MFDGRTPSRWLLAAALLASAGGCGYSEDEMAAKIREGEALKTQLTAEQDRNKSARTELDDQAAKIEQLKQQLKSAGVDVSNLNANLEQQARAMEEYRRHAEQLDATKKRFDVLSDKLRELAKLGLVVTVRNNRMVIQLPGDVLFDAGRETLKKEGETVLRKVADVIRGDPGLAARTFQVAGHTDDEPQKGGRFKDNWALSLLRAREVLALLVTPQPKGGGGLNPSRWSAAGYGETDPLKPNDTPEAKQANRRCELVVMPNVEEILDLKELAK